jgi:hypothetical protein
MGQVEPCVRRILWEVRAVESTGLPPTTTPIGIELEAETTECRLRGCPSRCPSDNRKRPWTSTVDDRRKPLIYLGIPPIRLLCQGPRSVFTQHESMTRSQPRPPPPRTPVGRSALAEGRDGTPAQTAGSRALRFAIIKNATATSIVTTLFVTILYLLSPIRPFRTSHLPRRL